MKTRWQRFKTGDFDADWVLFGLITLCCVALVIYAVVK